MLKKMLATVGIAAVSVMAYTGALHAKFMTTVPTYLVEVGYKAEADTLIKYMGTLKKGSQSPDNDYPELIIPDNLIPAWLKPVAKGNSIGKWEHTLVDDLPFEIKELLRIAVSAKGQELKFADTAMKDWFDIAVDFWAKGQIDSSMWHLGRACHLMQDITVPMHCKISGQLSDVWQVINQRAPNHEKFEKYCTEHYVTGKKTVNIWEQFKLPNITYEVAKESRKTLRFCDGIGRGGIFNAFPLKVMLPCLVEDYDKAMKVSATRGEIYTAKLVFHFFQTINMSK